MSQVAAISPSVVTVKSSLMQSKERKKAEIQHKIRANSDLTQIFAFVVNNFFYRRRQVENSFGGLR